MSIINALLNFFGLGSGWSAITGLAGTIGGFALLSISQIWALFSALAVEALNPGYVLDLVGLVLTSFTLNFAGFLPNGLTAFLTTAQGFFSGGGVVKVVALAAYCFSPIVDPFVFLACLDMWFTIWYFSFVISLLMSIKGIFWAQGS